MMNLNSIYSNGLAKPDPPLLRRHVDDVKNGEKAKRRGSDPKLYSSFNFPDLPKANSILTYNDLKGIPIHVSDLKSYYYVNTLKSQKDQFMDINELCKQYRNIQNNTGASSEASSIQVNKAKNRYLDIRPYDHSRVLLQPLKGVENSDYINASFINGYNMRTNAYIASQAPKANTVVDMWRMIWQERCSIIIMIANVIENGRQKCERYWPKTLNEKFGDIEVITTAAEGFAFYIQRKFMLRKGKESRTVLHVQFTGWPDHGVPNSKLDLLNFYYKIRNLNCDPPWLVHCSAGIGRTGSFIALDYLLEQAAHEDIVDVFKCVSHMRLNRHQMVQTQDQYQFIFEVVLEALKLGDTAVPIVQVTDSYCEDFVNSKEVVKLLKPNIPIDNMIGRTGATPMNKNRNRILSPIPSDECRAKLPGNKTDYINSVLVDSYSRKNAFIVTQIPLKHTQADFWQMILHYGCNSIVLLCTLDEDMYWPTEGSLKFDEINLVVRFIHKKRILQSRVIERQFELTDLSRTMKRNVCQWEVFVWPADNDTSILDEDLLLSLDETVVKWQKDQRCIRPVVVQCLYGLDRSDLYVTLCYVLQKMSSDSVLDIPYAVRHVRENRPEFMTSSSHIRHICDVVLSLINDDNADYANQ